MFGLEAAAAAAPLAAELDCEPTPAACATWLALFTIELAAESALARFGRDPEEEEEAEGTSTAASGEEAAADITLEARLEAEDPEAVETGRVWM